ncbi:MAG: methionyl-tRNA formyltransferase [Actinobacteria bacterium RBG_19FT_COMBO_70_19]|jgi:methionyl-tRNA formyltransferase|nr:MAG: methionyl-tRNA formyltransferase [Actinobacteria bacterium RBG_19FT_COMBO_70_19]
MTETRSLRVAFLGNDAWSVPSLGAIARSRHLVVTVVTAEPKPAGRGNELTPTPVAVEAERLGLPLLQTSTVRTGAGFKELSTTAPDVLAVVAYGELLTPNVLHVPTIAPVNVHFSLLPQLRGAAPVQTALLAGLDRTGVTTMMMDKGLDTGPVILQREERILPEDDAGSLGERLAEIGAELLVETLDMLASGPVAPQPQDPSLATLAPKFGPEDRVLDWSYPAALLVNLVRALSPTPAATTTFRGEGLKVFKADAVDATGEPGRIVEVSKRGLVVATAEGGFRPRILAPAGRRLMQVEDFVNGHHPEVGERLG